MPRLPLALGSLPPRRILRPGNYAHGTPGFGVYQGALPTGQEYAVINLQGRVFMSACDDPFRKADELLAGVTAKVVLVDLHAEAWREAMLHYGKDVPAEKLRWDIGKGADQLLPSYFSAEELAQFEEELTKHRSELYMEKYFPRVKALPAVKALFARLKEDGKRIVLASSANEKELEKLVELAGVKDFVEGSTSSDDAEKSKPHPDIFEAALDKLGSVDLREVLVIGDTAHDAEAAGKLGLKTLGVRTGGWSDERLLEAGCVAIYDSPEDLLAHYEAWARPAEERVSQPT